MEQGGAYTKIRACKGGNDPLICGTNYGGQVLGKVRRTFVIHICHWKTANGINLCGYHSEQADTFGTH